MKWSKLQSLVESRFAPAVQGRVAIYSTTYGRSTAGHAWIELDKRVLANFDTQAFCKSRPFLIGKDGNYVVDQDGKAKVGPIPDWANTKKYDNQPVEYGELSRQDVYEACWAFVHDLTVDEALASQNPILQSLAVLDARLGKRRLNHLNSDSLHPLAAQLLQVRVQGEDI
ncbi:MAG: hypothetical protein AAF267_06945 [Deinococcota bacterium]